MITGVCKINSLVTQLAGAEESMDVPLGSAALLGLIQGFAELFPFSSLGLLVILPHVIHLQVPTHGARYLPFLVALHAGTAIALLLLFWHEWVSLVRGWFLWLKGEHTAQGRMAWMLIWATIPVGLVGLALKHSIAHLFSKPLLAAIFLIINGFVMLLGDRWHKNNKHPVVFEKMSIKSAVKIGLFQILALIPGLSRSGATITGGVGQGLSFEDSAHFSFLLATPIIFAAALLELPKLGAGGQGLIIPALFGGVIAGITAWLSARFLLRYFRLHNLFQLALISIAVGIAGVALIH
jgi:undecaprenyl-diphosphatase